MDKFHQYLADKESYELFAVERDQIVIFWSKNLLNARCRLTRRHWRVELKVD